MRQQPRKLTDPELDILLSRGRLSGPAKERMLRAVLAGTANPMWFWQRWMASAAMRLTFVAAAVLAIAVAFGVWNLRSPDRDASQFQARGEPLQVGPQVDASCAGPCRAGDLLVLSVHGVPEPASLAAYTVAPDGQRIWYFPTDAGAMPRVDPTQVGPLRQGVRLKADHGVGTYELYTVFLRTPMTRDEILKLDTSPNPDVVIARVTRKFEIVP